MKSTTFELPMMYGDHHVVAVRNLLEALPGIKEIYASSSFHIVEIQYDDKLLSEEEIKYVKTVRVLSGESLYSHSWLEI